MCNSYVCSTTFLVCNKYVSLFLHFQFNENTHGDCQLPKVVISKACINDIPKTFMTGKSPFPALDTFVESIASFGNVSGHYSLHCGSSSHRIREICKECNGRSIRMSVNGPEKYLTMFIWKNGNGRE